MNKLFILAAVASTLLMAACNKPASIESVESLVANPERLKELRAQCKADHVKVGEPLAAAGFIFGEADHHSVCRVEGAARCVCRGACAAAPGAGGSGGVDTAHACRIHCARSGIHGDGSMLASCRPVS